MSVERPLSPPPKGHHDGHRTEKRPAYGTYCYDCGGYVTTYDP